MPRKIAAITDTAGISTLYLGGGGSGSTLVQARQEAHLYQLVRINKQDPRKIAMVSDTKLTFTIDGGANWNQQLLPGIGKVRQLQWVGLSTVIITRDDNIFRSDDSGFTIGALVVPASGVDIVDCYWESVTKGWFMRNDPVTETGYLFFTSDGSTWFTLDMSTITDWNLQEAPRRIINWAGPDIVLILTSHSVFSGTHSLDLSSNTFSRIWDYEPVVSALPGAVYAGYTLGVDENTRFDDLKSPVANGRIWLGGFQSLRAHSTGSSFYLTDLDAITLDPSVYYRHSVLDSLRVFAGSSEDSANLFPLRPGLNVSQTGGIDMAIYKNFPGETLLDHDALLADDIQGCSDPNACNFIAPSDPEYTGLIISDDGTCQDAVMMVGCQTGDIAHTTTPELVALGCRLPSVTITISSMTSDPDQHIEIASSGAVPINYVGDFSILTAFTLPERIAALIAELVASINASGQMRAFSNAAGEVTIVALTPNYASSVISISMTGVGYSNPSTFDGGTPGKVVRLEGKDECYYVCGAGQCSLDQEFTLLEVFENCIFCDVRAAGHICLNCSNVVSFNGVPLRTSDSFESPECIGIQGTLDVRVRASIPQRSYPSVSLNAPYACDSNPVVFSVAGDHTEHFTALSRMTTVPNGHVYTVASSSYDPDSGVTLITTVEACQGDVETALLPFDPCSCGVQVIYEEWISSAWSVIEDETFGCVNGSVSQDLQYEVDHASQYRIRVIATDCVEVQECIYYMISCAPLSIIETGCHTFSIAPAGNWHQESTGPAGTIKITDMVSNTVLVDEVLPWESIPFTVETNKDTLLVVEIQFGEQKYVQEIIDICDLRTCMKSLVNKLLCEEDPCENGDCSEAISILRSDANNANIIIGEIERVLRTYRYRWLGVYDYQAEQLEDLSAVVDLINMGRLLSGRCGECSDPDNTPCNNCSPA